MCDCSRMHFLSFVLTVLAIQSSPAPTEPAQKLANAVRNLESVQRTKEPTEAAEAEVARLGNAWLLDEANRAQGLSQEERTARFAELLRLARARGLKDTEVRLGELAKPVFEAWLQKAETLFTPTQALRAVAYRRALRDALPVESGQRALGGSIETRALEWLAKQRAKAAGDGDRFAVDSAVALVKRERMTLSPPLERLTHAAGPVPIASQCAKATPVLVASAGVAAVQSAQVAACSETTNDATETRSVPWTETISEMVEKQEKYISQEREKYTDFEQQETCVVSKTNHIAPNGSVAYQTEDKRCFKSPMPVEKERVVNVERTRPIQVMEKRDVSRQESFTVRVRTYAAAVRVHVRIEGDGQTVEQDELVRGTAKEEEFSSAHGGQSHITGAAKEKAMNSLKSEVAAYYQRVHGAWVKKRGEAMLATASSLDQKVTAAVLMGTVAPAVEQALRDALGMTTQEAAHLVTGDGELTSASAPTVVALVLPPPDVSVKNALETRELVVATTDAQSGVFGGLQLGVITGPISNGFGGVVIYGYRPAFSVRSHFLTRVVSQLEVGYAKHVSLDGHVRGEAGLQAGPLSLAGVGMVQTAGTFGGDDPFVAAAGYGARAQLSFEVFRAQFEAGPAPIAFGAETIVTRMHRRSSVEPIGTNMQATLFADLGHIVKITLVMRGVSRDDVDQFTSSKTRRWFAGLGLQSDF